MVDDGAKENKKSRTPSEELEEEVIRATRRKRVKFIDWDGKEDVIIIGPLPESILVEGAEIITEIVQSLINEYMTSAVAIRKATKDIDNPEAEVESIELFSSESILKALSKIPDALKYFIEAGTDKKYDDLKHDIGLCLDIILRVLDHNLGERLVHFLSPSGRRMGNLLMGSVPATGLNQKSSDGDTVETKSAK